MFASTSNFNGKAKFNDLRKSNGEVKKNTPFRRVREEEVEIDQRVKDMSFEAKVSASNGVYYVGEMYNGIVTICIITNIKTNKYYKYRS